MLSMLLLAGVCAWMPSFSDGGVACTPSNQLVECRCSECMTWNASVGVVREYRVHRDGDNVSGLLVGTTRESVIVVEDPMGDWIERRDPKTTWCVGRDLPMVREGITYTYRIVACNESGCSAYSQPVSYVGAPYAIDEFRPPTRNNP